MAPVRGAELPKITPEVPAVTQCDAGIPGDVVHEGVEMLADLRRGHPEPLQVGRQDIGLVAEDTQDVEQTPHHGL
eukprot:997586-Alexandrium_andersonii.AAC.1